MLQSCLLCDTVQLAANDTVLVLNSAADPFVADALQKLRTGRIILAEDNITTLNAYQQAMNVQHVAFHDYISHASAASVDVAVLNLLYQPSKAWILYGLHAAALALKAKGRLYVKGAKERGILSIGKHMEEQFGNVETLIISKGHRVLCSHVRLDLSRPSAMSTFSEGHDTSVRTVFADSKLDEGTRLLLEAMEVRVNDEALDIGCGAGFVGLHIAQLASKGHVTMLDASLAAIAVSQQAVEESGLTNVQVQPSDGVQAVQRQRFDLVATNPPFHQGGLQTIAIAERFIRGAAQVLRPQGRFYLVANRFLKYEPTLKANFKQVEEVGGNTRFKVIRANRAFEQFDVV
ncbi:MAG: methyltransferase [Ktedonobacteraceae bacterium]